MRLNAPEIIERHDTVKIQASIEHGAGREYLWYEMEAKYARCLTTKLDGFSWCFSPARRREERIFRSTGWFLKPCCTT